MIMMAMMTMMMMMTPDKGDGEEDDLQRVAPTCGCEDIVCNLKKYLRSERVKDFQHEKIKFIFCLKYIIIK